MFNSSVYIERRSTLSKDIDKGFVLLLGNNNVPMNYLSNPFPFVQDSSFLYYCGLDFPDLNILININTGSTTLYGIDQSVDDIIWEGELFSLKECAEISGIEIVKKSDSLFKDIEQINTKNESIHILPQYRSDLKYLLENLLGKSWKNHISFDLIDTVVRQRSIKADIEIAEIQNAMSVTAIIHKLAMMTTSPGRKEEDIVGELLGVVHSAGLRFAYPTILTENGEILHNHSHQNILREGQLLLHDGGAETKLHYATDITRTFPVSGKFSQIQKSIYEFVINMQEEVIKKLKPGVKYVDMHILASKICIDGLKSIGLMLGNTEDAFESGAHALFFPHGLGHMLGLDVHDMEALGEDYVGYDKITNRKSQFGISYLRLGKTLECGNVLTVEPGIYFISTLIDQWNQKGMHKEFINYSLLESFNNFGGIRIEDNVLITKNGCKNLSETIPKTIEDIENIVGRKSY